MDPSNTAKLQAMRFLFFRFNHTRYYHGLFILVRDLFICLVPAVFQDSALQACLVCIVLCIYVLVQQKWNPWHVHFANIIKGMITRSLIFILLAGTMITDMTVSKGVMRGIGFRCGRCFGSCLWRRTGRDAGGS